MKRSPSSSSSSDSSSCIEFSDPQQQQQQKKPDDAGQPKTKRARAKKNQKQENSSQINASKRSSIYRGVTRHRWTGRYEAHLWDKSTWNSIQNKRGRQIYLGAYDSEEAAARTYDLAALKYWGPGTVLNFPIETYTKEVEEMQKLSKEEYLASLRRRSSGFSRGVSKYRGVARHHHNGRWEARIGRVLGNKYLYLGTYSTQEEAAAAYDMAAIEYRGPNAVTNFDISNYIDILKKQKSASQIKQETPEESIEEQPIELLEQEAREECIDAKKPQEVIKQEALEEFIEGQVPHEVHDYQLYQQEERPLELEFGTPIKPETMVVMDPEDQHEHPWDLCLDMEFNPLDVPLDERHAELSDLLNDIEFEDDIDLIFDSAACKIDLNEDAMSSNTGCSLEAEALVVKEEKGGMEASASPALSPLSTTTSVSGEV